MSHVLHHTAVRPLILSAAVLWLSACPSTSSRPTQPTTYPTYPTQPITVSPNAPVAQGFVHQPVGSSAQYRVVSFSDLPQWFNQPFASSLQSFKNSCIKLASQAEWQYACARAYQTPVNHAAAKQFFEQVFTPWQVSDKGQLGGKVTGYYEPVLNGDVRRTNIARFPIYGIPNDLISVPLPSSLRNSQATIRVGVVGANRGVVQANGAYIANLAQFPERSTTLRGRIVGNQFVPYFTRDQINAGAIDGRVPILGYANNPVELFFMHVQGSGRLRTPSGQFVRLGFAEHNGHIYQSIGRYMANRNYLPLAQTSMQGIKAWIEANPQRLAEVLAQNPRYIFFRPLSGSSELGPIGALGVPLTGEFSGAVDKKYITLGAPLFLATTHPDAPTQGLNRLIIAQDTGAAIKGAVRVDYFWGYGEAAGQIAGKQNYTGYVWQLLPNGVLPRYVP